MEILTALLEPHPMVELAMLLGIVYLLGLAIRTPASKGSADLGGRARARWAPGTETTLARAQQARISPPLLSGGPSAKTNPGTGEMKMFCGPGFHADPEVDGTRSSPTMSNSDSDCP